MIISGKENLSNKLKFFDCDIWFINIEYVNIKLYKKNFLYGINFFMNNNKKNLFFSEKIKKIIPFYCCDEVYFSKNIRDEESNSIEFYIAFKSESDTNRCFNKLFQLEQNIYRSAPQSLGLQAGEEFNNKKS